MKSGSKLSEVEKAVCREERDEDEGPKPKHVLSQPLLQVQEKGVVLYTRVQGIRKTFEDSSNLRTVVHILGVLIHERDVSMHPHFRKQLTSLLGGAVSVSLPHIGGAEETEGSSMGNSLRMLRDFPSKKGEKRYAKYGCKGIRFMLRLECSGSCENPDEDSNLVVRCPNCIDSMPNKHVGASHTLGWDM